VSARVGDRGSTAKQAGAVALQPYLERPQPKVDRLTDAPRGYALAVQPVGELVEPAPHGRRDAHVGELVAAVAQQRAAVELALCRQRLRVDGKTRLTAATRNSPLVAM